MLSNRNIRNSHSRTPFIKRRKTASVTLRRERKISGRGRGSVAARNRRASLRHRRDFRKTSDSATPSQLYPVSATGFPTAIRQNDR